MKKLGVIFGITLFAFGGISVNADEVYYTNQNGVEFTETEYNYYTDMYYDGFQDAVTQSMLDEVNTYGFIGQPITKSVYDEDDQRIEPSRGLIHETNAKRLAMAKSCSGGYCNIVVTLTWKGQPKIKSYDVIGALLYGSINLNSEPSTYLGYSGGTLFYGDEYYVGGGFGTSVKLQTSSTFMHISQSYIVSGEGTLYASYQHAIQNITKATSQLYTVGYGGYGGVFHFYGNAIGKFDQMGGVDTYINV
jgi:hypothetical protein